VCVRERSLARGHVCVNVYLCICLSVYGDDDDHDDDDDNNNNNTNNVYLIKRSY